MEGKYYKKAMKAINKVTDFETVVKVNCGNVYLQEAVPQVFDSLNAAGFSFALSDGEVQVLQPSRPYEPGKY